MDDREIIYFEVVWIPEMKKRLFRGEQLVFRTFGQFTLGFRCLACTRLIPWEPDVLTMPVSITRSPNGNIQIVPKRRIEIEAICQTCLSENSITLVGEDEQDEPHYHDRLL